MAFLELAYGSSEKVAVIILAASIVTVQFSVPVHSSSLQPVNVDQAAGVAVKVTIVPLA